MQRSSKGIATMVLALVIVVVIAVAGAAAYFALSSGPSSSTASSVPTTTTSSVPSTTAATTTSVPTTSSSPPTSSSTTTSSTIPPSSTTTPTTTSATTTSSALSSSTCTSTYTSSTTPTQVDYTPQFINLIKTFSAMNFNTTETGNGKQESFSIGYTSTSPSSGVYNASIIEVANGTAVPSAWFLVDSNNNTVLQASYSGFTVTGVEAKSIFDESMAILGLNEYFSGELQVFTDPAYFTNQGTSTATFGTVSFPVTTWVANSLPESVSYCGVSATLTAYTLKVGTPPGTNLLFIVYLNFAGTSQGQSENVTFQLVSMVVRS